MRLRRRLYRLVQFCRTAIHKSDSLNGESPEDCPPAAAVCPVHGTPMVIGPMRPITFRRGVAEVRVRFETGRLISTARAPVKAIEQTGESPVQSCRYRSVAEGNCVFNRKGGKQLEANEQSVTKVNAIRPSLSGSVRAKREPLTSRHDPDAARLRVAD